MKNTYTPSENGGLARLADQGAREAKRDGQGFLTSLPERAREPSDYERLLQGLYDTAAWYAKQTGGGEELEIFCEGLEEIDESAAHQIREGVRHSRAEVEKRIWGPWRAPSKEGTTE